MIFGISFVGLWLPFLLVRVPNVQDMAGYLNSFSGGIFLTIGLSHILPDALDLQAQVKGLNGYPLFPVLSVITFYLLLMIERIVLHTHGHVPVCVEEHHCDQHHGRCEAVQLSGEGPGPLEGSEQAPARPGISRAGSFRP